MLFEIVSSKFKKHGGVIRKTAMPLIDPRHNRLSCLAKDRPICETREIDRWSSTQHISTGQNLAVERHQLGIYPLPTVEPDPVRTVAPALDSRHSPQTSQLRYTDTAHPELEWPYGHLERLCRGRELFRTHHASPSPVQVAQTETELHETATLRPRLETHTPGWVFAPQP